MSKYVCQKLDAHTERGNKWALKLERKDGSSCLLGFHRTRKACITVARLLAGWSGKVVVRDKPVRVTAWRIEAPSGPSLPHL